MTNVEAYRLAIAFLAPGYCANSDALLDGALGREIHALAKRLFDLPGDRFYVSSGGTV